MTVQKFDGRIYMHDEWETQPPQRVGVAVKDAELLEIYRQSIIDYSHKKA